MHSNLNETADWLLQLKDLIRMKQYDETFFQWSIEEMAETVERTIKNIENIIADLNYTIEATDDNMELRWIRSTLEKVLYFEEK